MIITGGDTVSRYSTLGFLEDLPALNEYRRNHGCGAYSSEDGTQVRLLSDICNFDIHHIQTLLVTGGLNGFGEPLATTEILTSSSSVWSLATPLPRTLHGLRGVTLDGALYITGEGVVMMTLC